MTAIEATTYPGNEYKRRVRAWTMYDWANSAFATTIMTGLLPVYYSQVAGSTLPSEAAATALWSMSLSLAMIIITLLGPILGTISDITRAKKRFLAFFVGLGVTCSGLMVLIGTGDWLLASFLFIFGRIGFGSANVFYDSLLPHVAREEDRDRVSSLGYALGYLGGGLLLAVNILMIFLIPDIFEYAGIRLSMMSVAVWWAVFSMPILTRVPEPPTATGELTGGVVVTSFRRLRDTLRDIRRYRELFKYLVAYLIYNDGIATIFNVALIYGAELGIGTVELVLALLLVNFVGIPFSLVFGQLPRKEERRRPFYLAFVLFNLVMLPLVGVIGLRLLPQGVTGALPSPYEDTATAVGEGVYPIEDDAVRRTGTWEMVVIPAEELSGGGFFEFVNALFGEAMKDTAYAITDEAGARYDLAFNGQAVEVHYSVGPDRGMWAVELDGQPYWNDDGEIVTIDAYSETVRYGVIATVIAGEPGEHLLSLVNTGKRNPDSSGNLLAVAQVEVMPPTRQNNLVVIIGLILGVQAAGVVFAALLGRPLFSGLAGLLDTKRSLILALIVYAAIAVWGYFLDSTLEFWFLAWMLGVVQGGGQALSRSLYSSMSPAAKSGEFFGLFGVMEKFSAILGPIFFALAGTLAGSSRPALLSLILFFFVGIFLLTRVNVSEGRRVAQQEDRALLSDSPVTNP